MGQHVHPLWRGVKRPSAVAQMTWRMTDNRSGIAGMRQMAACMSPGPGLAACRRTKIASFFSEQKCGDGSLEGGVVPVGRGGGKGALGVSCT